MKLSEAIGMIEKNYKLRFRSNRRETDKGYSELSCSNKGFITIINCRGNGEEEQGARKEFNGMITNYDNWELIEEPMTFEELLRTEKLSKKYIKVKYFDCETCYDSLKGIMQYLSETNASNDLIEIIKHGEWYVKENK